MKRSKSRSGNPTGFRSGIFLFLSALILLQAARSMLPVLLPVLLPGDQAAVLDQDEDTQALMDSLRQAFARREARSSQTYDANYLNDYRGYRLGLSAEAMDRLYAFRENGGRLHSLEHFGRVAQVSGPGLEALRERLRFSEASAAGGNRSASGHKRGRTGRQDPPPKAIGLNTATARDLQAVRGIGPVLSERILKFRKALGGFLHESQLLDVYGLPPEVARRAMGRFKVLQPPGVKPVNLNTATIAELAALVYLNRKMAEDLVHRRSVKGPYTSIDEITEVESIPKDKTARIALYLSF